MRRRERLTGRLRRPGAEELAACAPADFLSLAPGEAEALLPFVDGILGALDEVETLPDPEPPVRHGVRDPGRVPAEEEDPFNALARTCLVEGAPEGPLAGRTVVVKDTIAVAGIPVSNASRTLAYVPTLDAVVVERVLAAGGTIVGKANMDDFSGSGYGETSVFGPPRNPRDPTRTPGGSSGGSAAAVAGGLADLAIGGDTAGSGRIPAALCGCVALKATHGLVPSFGATTMDGALDALTPIGRTSADVALLLSAIAGEDWREPHGPGWPQHGIDYGAGIDGGVAGLRVGVIAESLDETLCEPGVLAGVTRATDALRAAGATVETVSIPLWRHAFAIWAGILLGTLPESIRRDGVPTTADGYVDLGRTHATALSRRLEADLLPPTLKLFLLVNTYVRGRYFQVPFARAQNQRLVLRREVDDALARYDLLVAPTVPRVAEPLATAPLTEIEAMRKITSQTVLASPFNVTGHPALAVPSGTGEAGMPTSVQLVGAPFADALVLRAGHALEGALG